MNDEERLRRDRQLYGFSAVEISEDGTTRRVDPTTLVVEHRPPLSIHERVNLIAKGFAALAAARIGMRLYEALPAPKSELAAAVRRVWIDKARARDRETFLALLEAVAGVIADMGRGDHDPGDEDREDAWPEDEVTS